MKYLLGYDIGSSSIKTSLLDADTGMVVNSAYSPGQEMEILSVKPGFAEQDPENWWQELIRVTIKIKKKIDFKPEEILAIGISYQMHGLVCVDRRLKPLRPAIIWCDSRGVDTGDRAFKELGTEYCLKHFLNSPGNFTASKLKWVRENEPELYALIYKVMLPGDFIALKLTGEAVTTISGLSEGIFWDYLEKGISDKLLSYYGIEKELIAPLVPSFGIQGRISQEAAILLGIKQGTPVTYRAGDQPNNAFSLNALQPGEIAATAGTSGVVFGVTDQPLYDPLSRVNAFVHVNHQSEKPRYGVLLCVNGTGILNSWLRKNFFKDLSYEEINQLAGQVLLGSEGLRIFPFGNGAERILANLNPGACFSNLQFNTHHRGHIARAAQEGIVFALNYGMEIMEEMGMQLQTIRAGHANMFLSPVFAQTFANVSGCVVELFQTDGAAGAARAAGLGVGFYKDFKECFRGMEIVSRIEPEYRNVQAISGIYQEWKKQLSNKLML